MKLSINNFLTQIKNITMGGGRNSASEPIASSGYLKDVTFPLTALSTQNTLTDSTTGAASTTLAAITNPTFAWDGLTDPSAAEATAINAAFTSIKNSIASLAAQLNAKNLEASETNLLVQSFPASTTSLGSFSMVIPRDYDENTDTFALKLAAASAGATNTPGITATVYRKRPGSAIATVATAVAAKVPGVTTAAALSTASQVLEINFSSHGLQRDDALTIVLTASAHTTDAVLIYSIEPVYRSTLVSYDQTDGTSNFNGVNLR